MRPWPPRIVPGLRVTPPLMHSTASFSSLSCGAAPFRSATKVTHRSGQTPTPGLRMQVELVPNRARIFRNRQNFVNSAPMLFDLGPTFGSNPARTGATSCDFGQILVSVGQRRPNFAGVEQIWLDLGRILADLNLGPNLAAIARTCWAGVGQTWAEFDRVGPTSSESHQCRVRVSLKLTWPNLPQTRTTLDRSWPDLARTSFATFWPESALLCRRLGRNTAKQFVDTGGGVAPRTQCLPLRVGVVLKSCKWKSMRATRAQTQRRDADVCARN